MSNDTKKSPAFWLMVVLISGAAGLFTNALIFFVIMMVSRVDSDEWARWYFGGENYYFIGISLVLALFYIPLVKRIPNKTT